MSDVKLPYKMRKLPRFAGYVIPYTTWIHPITHEPDFKINDERRRLACVRGKKCSMCGEKMNKLFAFIGGSGSIEHSQLFVDAGMHPACAAYAWEVCPYLVYGKGHAKHGKVYEGAVVEVFRDIPTEKPDKMGMAVTDSYTIVEHEGSIFVRAGKPISVVWRVFPK